MKIDFDLLRSQARRADTESPFEIAGDRPRIDFGNGEDVMMRIEIPKDEGAEFAHWRHLHESGVIRVSHDGRPGVGKLNNRVNGVTAKGREFVMLSENDDDWRNTLEVCEQARALTFPMVLAELRKKARERVSAAKRAAKRVQRGTQR